MCKKRIEAIQCVFPIVQMRSFFEYSFIPIVPPRLEVVSQTLLVLPFLAPLESEISDWLTPQTPPQQPSQRPLKILHG